MPTKQWILTDLDQDLYVENLFIAPDDVGGSATGYTVNKRRLQGGLRDGVDVLEVNNGAFRYVVVPTRGMGLWKASHAGVQLGWKSPVRGPVHPSLVRLWEPSGIGWLDGFDELLCRCGLESNGAPEFDAGTLRYPLHGRIANIPAHRVELTIDGDTGEIRIVGVVDEARLFGAKLRLTTTLVTRVGQPGLTIHDRVENLSAEPAEMELLYHINFGMPLVGPGARFVGPVRRVAPRDAVAVGNLAEWDSYGPETPGSFEAVFFMELAADAAGQTRVLLHNAAADQGVSLAFNVRQLPQFILWKNRQAAADGYVTGLEPAINLPNARSFEKEKGRVKALPPGGCHETTLMLEAHASTDAVAAARSAVAQLQGSQPPEVLAAPWPEWSKG